MGKIKILQSVGSLGIGGNEMFVMNFFRHLDKTKYQVDFLIFENRLDFYDEVKEAGSKVFICPEIKGNKLKQLIHQMRYVNKILKNNKYDVLHCHGCSFVNIMRSSIPGWKKKNIKVITHSHNTGMPKNTKIDDILRFFLKWILSHTVNYGLACSDLAGESKYAKKFIHSSQYGLIHNAIEVDKYRFNTEKREKIRTSIGLIENDILIGNIGRLAEQKNQKFLISLLRKINDKYPNIYLIIVGGGDLEKNLKRQAKDLNIEKNIIFTGSVNNAMDYYSAMDVFVMPSLYEGLPFTAVEAQVNGLKCVMADTITKMVNISGDVSFLSLRQKKEDWIDTILENSRSRSSKQNNQIVCKKYDLNNEVKRLESYYDLKMR